MRNKATKKNKGNKTTISHKELRYTFYRLRDFEISNLWQRSIFLSALLVSFLPAYSFLVTKLLEKTDKYIVYHELCCALALCGMAFSILWIMMAKGSKAWFEIYEKQILKIEKEENLGIEEKYRMGGELSPWDLDSNLLSGKAGAYSVSKLNILIGQFLFALWIIVFIIHYIGIIISFISMQNSCIPHTIILTLLPILVILVIVTASKNMWAKSGCLENP